MIINLKTKHVKKPHRGEKATHQEKPTPYNPWKYLQTHHPQIQVKYEHLPHNQCAKTNGKTIIIDKTLNQAQRRSVLMHELIHLERGTNHINIKEEKQVDKIAATRLIELNQLIKALCWTGGKITQETADELWVDYYTLTTRIENLNEEEINYIFNELEI